MSEENLNLFLNDVKGQCPQCEVLTSEEDRLIYSHGCYPREYKWILQGKYPCIAGAVLRPADVNEVSALVRLAASHKVGIIPYGGGSGIVGGTEATGNRVIVDTKRLTDFSFNPVNMTARGGAGLSGAEFENKLNIAGFTTGHYPQSYQSACLGGMTATRAIGTYSTKYGKMDDMVTALEVVLPDGQILRTHEAPKRSTGPELMQVFLGSEGAYGIVTSVEMKIYPLPELRFFRTYTFPRTEDGLEAIRTMIQHGIRPAVVRLYDEAEAVHKMLQNRFEKGFALLVLVFEGFTEETELEAKKADGFCLGHEGRRKDEKAAVDWNESRFSTKKMLDYDAIEGGTADAIEVAAPWDKIADVWREMRKALEPLCESLDCHFSHVYHNGASVYVIFHAKTGGDDKAGEERYLQCLKLAIETSIKYGGNVSHHHGVGTAKARFLPLEHGESGVWVMKAIKNGLDPQGIMNKGVLGL
jgi:alkyldihydroxyacetonephosphate synthase